MSFAVDPDFALLQATAQGDHGAFEDLIRRYQNPVLSFIYRLLRDRPAAEDLAQEVFLRVYQAAPRFEPKARVSTWIFKIAYHLSINEMKRCARLARWTEQSCVGDRAIAEGNCAATMECNELKAAISAALDRLPEKQKAALLLRINEELCYRDIGEVLQVSVASVEALIFRARKNLKQYLAETGRQQGARS